MQEIRACQPPHPVGRATEPEFLADLVDIGIKPYGELIHGRRVNIHANLFFEILVIGNRYEFQLTDRPVEPGRKAYRIHGVKIVEGKIPSREIQTVAIQVDVAGAITARYGTWKPSAETR